jgi:hypothetical protein
MKRGRFTFATIAALAIPALALSVSLGRSGSAGAASTRPAGVRAAGTRTVVVDCLGKPQARPGTFVLTCADGNDALTRLSWTSWAPKLASAAGTQKLNDCIPYCAIGHFHSYPVLVVLWGGAALKGHPGERRYTMITIIYPGARPKIYNGHKWVEGPLTVTSPLWA